METSTFKIGENVLVIDENLEGIITKMVKSKIWILTQSGFEYCYEAKKLIPAHGDFLKDFQFGLHREAKKRRKEKSFEKKTIKKSKKKTILEVDLHIEKLLDFPQKYHQRDCLFIQLTEARKKIEQCMERNQKQLIFIHGQGGGVLKKALHELLDQYPNIEYFDAPYKKFGMGATEIYIYYTKVF